jgi:hypothetical protein
MIYDANLLQEMILLFALFFVISLGIYMAVRKEVGGKKDLHNGDLSRYLIWMIMGMSVFMIILIWGMVL